jgi:hypothetical protein
MLMTKTRKPIPAAALRFMVAALAILSAISLPRSSYAQVESQTWTGDGSVLTLDFTYGPQGPDETGSIENISPATLTLTYVDDAILTITINDYSLTGPILYDPFAAGSASMMGFGSGPGGGISIGSFDMTSSGVVADLLLYDLNVFGTGDVYQVQFNTVPEPSSIVLAVTGALTVSALAWMRRRQAT